MKFCWTTINVHSMEDSLNFYENVVGLKLQSRVQDGPDFEMAFLGEGETKIELIYYKDKPVGAFNENISIGFKVDDANEMIEFLNKKGINIESPIIEPNPHVRFFFVKDPNGLRVQFVENK